MWRCRKMTKEKFKIYLDSIFISLKDNPYGKNYELSPQDEYLLLDVCNIVKYNVDKAKNDINDYNKAFNQNIVPVLRSWINSKKKNETSPYLLRQVIYYLCCTAYRDGIKEYQQTALIKKISMTWRISQNVWNKWEMYPKKLYRTLYDKQPERIFPYKGSKTDAIGLGVRYLAFQAGAYSNFVDIYGGSGFASASVIHTQGTKYFYNELNRHVRNLFEVLVDDALYKEYIVAVNDFKYDLRHKAQKKSVFKNIDLDVDGYDAYNNIKALNEEESEIKAYNDKFVMSKKQVDDAYNEVKNNYIPFCDNKSYDCYDKSYSCHDILYILKFDNMKKLDTQNVIEKYRTQVYGILEETFTGRYKKTRKKVTLKEYLVKLEVYYAFGYWLYCQVLINTSGDILKNDKVKYAVASTYLYSLAINGIDMDSSSEARNFYYNKMGYDTTYSDHSGTKYDNFIERNELLDSDVGKEFEKRVTDFHNIIKDENISHYDAIDLVKNYQKRLKLRNQKAKNRSDNVLFYSDSPYIGTSDYEDEANGVSSFTEDNMFDLIQALIDSGQKFIFSCRATASSAAKGKNLKIKKNVFEVFEKKKTTSLYVTAVLGRKKAEKEESFNTEDLIQRFADSIRNNKGTELYITNYRVRYYYSVVFNTDYLVINYDEFMELMKENLNK